VRTPLLRGRVFNDQDAVGSQPVVIVNQTIADRYWPKQDPIGRHLANSRDRIQRVVVGVVAGVKFNTLNAPDVEEMYLPVDQSPWPAVTLIIRSESSSKPLIAAVREQLAQLDPSLPIAGVLSMQDVISLSVAQPRIVMQFVGIFAGMALALAAVGLYAVVAYSVTQRNHEMGIRMALGAQRRDILALVVRYGMELTLVGVGLGIVASLALTRLLASLLFGIGATDPMTFSSAAALLMGTAVFACYLPARRATRVDPMMALRNE
jgi:putative ABC transport system permease protein